LFDLLGAGVGYAFCFELEGPGAKWEIRNKGEVGQKDEINLVVWLFLYCVVCTVQFNSSSFVIITGKEKASLMSTGARRLGYVCLLEYYSFLFLSGKMYRTYSSYLPYLESNVDLLTTF
jgi:hypothetical protein